MKKTALIILVSVLTICLVGCGRKQDSLEEMQEPISMETLSAIDSEKQVIAQNQVPEMQSPQQAPAQLEPLPPQGPYKPTAREIQTALKNANYYTGAIDGKVGPMTKKAIEEFQKANGLQADGKVGLKTWAILSKYLNPEPISPVTGTKKR